MMNKLILAISMALLIYAGFNLTIGVWTARTVRDFGAQVDARMHDGAMVFDADSSSCNLLVEAPGWRGWLEAGAYPFAARDAQRIKAKFTFELSPDSVNRSHCAKFNNRLLVNLRKPA